MVRAAGFPRKYFEGRLFAGHTQATAPEEAKRHEAAINTSDASNYCGFTHQNRLNTHK